MLDHVAIKERLLIHEAKRWVGVSEIGGNNRGQLVELFQKSVDGIAGGEPWCAAFAQFCIDAVDDCYESAFCDSVISLRSPIFRSEHCLTVWNRSRELQLEKPKPGSLCIWQMHRDGATSAGHVGVVVGVNDDGTLLTVEGNTSGADGLQREGDGVWLKRRRWHLDENGSAMRVKGFLRVW